MVITGKTTPNDGGCGSAGQTSNKKDNCGKVIDNLLILHGELQNQSSECEGISFRELSLPITGFREVKKVLGVGEKMVVEPSKVYAVYVGNNLNTWWRKIDKYCNRENVLNYDVKIVATSSNIRTALPTVDLVIDMTPHESPTIVATWNTMGDLQLGGYQFITWNDVPLSWENLREHRLNNVMCLPSFSKTESIQISMTDQDNGEADVIIKMGDDRFVYSIRIHIVLDLSANTFVINAYALDVHYEFSTAKISSTRDSMVNYMGGNELLSTSNHKFFTQNAVRYSSLRAMLVLSSLYKEDQVEIFNQCETNPREVRFAQFD